MRKPKALSPFIPLPGVRILRRRCEVCGLKKPNTNKCWDFSQDTPTQLNLVCRRCDHQRSYRTEHKDEIADYKRSYRTEHKDEIADYQRRYYAERKRKKLIGIRPIHTLQERHHLLTSQYGGRSMAEALGIEVERGGR